MTEALLDIQSLRVVFPGAGCVVDDVSLSVNQGEMHALVGESGSGKSVTALATMGLLPRSASWSAKALRFDGDALSDAVWARRRGAGLAMIFQEPVASLNPVRRIGEQIREGLPTHVRRRAKESHARIDALLHEVGLVDGPRVRRAYPHELSGGMCQRVMIAAALAGEPRLLIADEPTTALDVVVQHQVLALLDRLRASRGLAVLLITHDLGLVAQWAQRATVMRRGRIVEQGEVSSILRGAREEYTRQLLASRPRLRVSAAR